MYNVIMREKEKKVQLVHNTIGMFVIFKKLCDVYVYFWCVNTFKIGMNGVYWLRIKGEIGRNWQT